MRLIGKCLVAAAVLAAMVLTAPAAHADTGACVSFLEDGGEDTTVRNAVCLTTETVGDTVSAQYAFDACVPLMSVTGLPEALSVAACHLAIEP